MDKEQVLTSCVWQMVTMSSRCCLWLVGYQWHLGACYVRSLWELGVLHFRHLALVALILSVAGFEW
jgi:hypothetical protein